MEPSGGQAAQITSVTTHLADNMVQMQVNAINGVLAAAAAEAAAAAAAASAPQTVSSTKARVVCNPVTDSDRLAEFQNMAKKHHMADKFVLFEIPAESVVGGGPRLAAVSRRGYAKAHGGKEIPADKSIRLYSKGSGCLVRGQGGLLPKSRDMKNHLDALAKRDM